MSYSTIDEIKKRISSQLLLQITTESKSETVINEVIVETAILDADTLIDSYLERRYNVPVDPVPARLLKLSCDIAIYNIYTFKYDTQVPEEIRKRYDEAVGYLEKIQQGDIFIKDAESLSELIILTNKEDQLSYYDEEILDQII